MCSVPFWVADGVILLLKNVYGFDVSFLRKDFFPIYIASLLPFVYFFPGYFMTYKWFRVWGNGIGIGHLKYAKDSFTRVQMLEKDTLANLYILLQLRKNKKKKQYGLLKKAIFNGLFCLLLLFFLVSPFFLTYSISIRLNSLIEFFSGTKFIPEIILLWLCLSYGVIKLFLNAFEFYKNIALTAIYNLNCFDYFNLLGSKAKAKLYKRIKQSLKTDLRLIRNLKEDFATCHGVEAFPLKRKI